MGPINCAPNPICEFEAFKTLDCYTIHYQNCNTHEVGVVVYKNNAFRNLEYNIEKAPADLIILQSKGLNLADTFHCVGLRVPRKYAHLEKLTLFLCILLDTLV